MTKHEINCYGFFAKLFFDINEFLFWHFFVYFDSQKDLFREDQKKQQLYCLLSIVFII